MQSSPTPNYKLYIGSSLAIVVYGILKYLSSWKPSVTPEDSSSVNDEELVCLSNIDIVSETTSLNLSLDSD